MANLLLITNFVNMLAELTPQGKTISKEAMKMYHLILHDVTDESLKAAVMDELSQDKPAWMPSPGQLRELCRKWQAKANTTVRCNDFVAIYDVSLEEKEETRRLFAHLETCEICRTPKKVPALSAIPLDIGKVTKRLK